MDRRLIDSLVQANLLSRQDMQRIILRASSKKTSVVNELLDGGVVNEDTLARAIAHFYGLELVNPKGFRADPSALGLVPERMARASSVLPYALNASRDRVFVVLSDPELAQDVLERLREATGNDPDVRIGTRRWVAHALDHFYSAPAAVGAGILGRPNTSGAPFTLSRPHATFNGPPSLAEDPINQALDDLDEILESGVKPPARPAFASNPLDSLDLDDLTAASTPRPPSTPSARPLSSGPVMGDLSHFGQIGEKPDWERVPDQWSWDDFVEQGKILQRQRPGAPANGAPTNGTPANGAAANPVSLFEPTDLADPEASPAPGLVEIINHLQRELFEAHKELRRQREVVQVMADMLVEARIIDQSELRTRLRRVRKARSS